MNRMLRGNALAKIDGKGRLKLPAIFRSVIEPTYGSEFFVTSLRGESARIYPMEVYARLEERLLQSSSVQPLVTKLRNALNYFGQRAVMDTQGRILIHPLLRDKTKLDGDVAVLGQQNYLEVWSRKSVEESLFNNPLTEDELMELATLGF
jgi:MraZ protein